MQLIVMSALLAVSSQQPTAELSKNDLALAVAVFEHSKGDQFTPRATQESIIGKRFRSSTAFPMLSDAGGPRMDRLGGWSYDPNSQKMIFDPWIAFIVGSDLKTDPMLSDGFNTFRGFTVIAKTTYSGKYTGANAFGATHTMDAYMGSSITIAAYSAKSSASTFPQTSIRDDVKSITIAPEAARDLAPHLILVVEGTIVAYAANRAIACGDSGTAATMESRYQRLSRECVVSANIDRYAIEDVRSGRSLAAWTPDPTP